MNGETELRLYGKAQQWQKTLAEKNHSKLKYLNLCACRIANEQLNTIINTKLEQLQQLNLSSNQIQEKGVEILLKVDWKKLKNLNLYNNSIGDEGCKKLFKSGNLKSLERIDIPFNKISPMGFTAMPFASMEKMQILNLSENVLGANGVKLLVKASFPNLKKLEVRKCEISNEGALHLTKGYWRMLKDLDIGNNKIQEKGFRDLMIYGDWRNLGFIWILDTKPEFMHDMILPKFAKEFRYYTDNRNSIMKEEFKKLLDNKLVKK